ncbi:MAG: hypothetical protein J6Z11_03895 [Candidatus Riflebacteria bacterium]|nr:hypothetical protein [Candidatus Riflebacteria bacterium]
MNTKNETWLLLNKKELGHIKRALEEGLDLQIFGHKHSKEEDEVCKICDKINAAIVDMEVSLG